MIRFKYRRNERASLTRRLFVRRFSTRNYSLIIPMSDFQRRNDDNQPAW